MIYTVKTATTTGKEDATYGKEYLVNFNETDQTVRVSKKFPLTPGTQMIGDIINNANYGPYFKSAPRDGTPMVPGATGTTSPRPAQTPSKIQADKNNSFYVAYVKDMMIAYLDIIGWDWDKYNDEKFNNAIGAVASGAKQLRDAVETSDELTIQDVEDSWANIG